MRMIGKILLLVTVSAALENPPVPKHLRAVTIPDDQDVIYNNATDNPFSGFSVDYFDALSRAGGFTYNITSYPGGYFGNKQASGKWDGLVGAVLDGEFDVILNSLTLNGGLRRILDMSSLSSAREIYALASRNETLNATKYFTTPGALKLMQLSQKPEVWAVAEEIGSRKPDAVVSSLDSVIERTEKGEIFLNTKPTVDRLAKGSGGLLRREGPVLSPGVWVYFYGTKKGSEAGTLLNNIPFSAVKPYLKS